MTEVVASAPGKIILTGEHFVVHGACAIAAAVDRRVKVTFSSVSGQPFIQSGRIRSALTDKDGKFLLVKAILREVQSRNKARDSFAVKISSDIPAGSGLGSSAAVAVATSAAALKFNGLEATDSKIQELAMIGEKQVHGNPSGIDVESSMRGGLILFSRASGAKSVPLDKALNFLIVYSGKTRKTSALISRVSLKKEMFPHFFSSLARSASFLSLEFLDALTCGDLPRIGALMNISQATLDWIGVSTPSMDKLIENLASQDVFGVKLTGAGGGGSVIALPKPGSNKALSKYVRRNFQWSFFTSLPQEGLRWENSNQNS